MAGNPVSADATFQNRARNTSAHYGLEDAVVHQYVKEVDTAYAAGNWTVNQETINIEHSAQPGRAPSDGTYENSAQIIAAAAKRYGFRSTLEPSGTTTRSSKRSVPVM
jgi:N-acetylmuramoyl-L-alanine amidase